MISAEELKTFAAAAGVVAAVVIAIALRRYANVVRVVDGRGGRDAETREWQKAIVHQLMHESDLETLSIDEIHRLYSRRAAEFKDVIRQDGALSELALRRALIELVSSGVLGQTNRDEYFIFSHERALGESRAA